MIYAITVVGKGGFKPNIKPCRDVVRSNGVRAYYTHNY